MRTLNDLYVHVRSVRSEDDTICIEINNRTKNFIIFDKVGRRYHIGMSRFGIVVSFLLFISFTQISCIAAMGLCPRFVSKIRSLIII